MQPATQSHSTTTLSALPTLAQALFDGLTASVRGEVYRRGDHRYVAANVSPGSRSQFFLSRLSFQEHTRLFNGNVLNTSKAVVLPLDAHDVSKYAALLPYGLTTADMFAGSLSSVTSTDYRHPSRPAAMAQAVGPSMETLSSTCPRYKTSMSNRH